MKQTSFAHRLTQRIVIILALINVVIISCVLYFVVHVTRSQSQEHFQGLVNYTDKRMESMLSFVETLAHNNVAAVEMSLQSPEQVYAAMERELKMNPHVVGLFAAFDPYYFPEQGRWFEPYVVRRGGEQIEKSQIGSADHDYLTREWFINARKSEKGYWSDPYFDPDGAKAMLCSYVIPLHDKHGNIIGTFGADLPLDWLANELNRLDNEENDRIYGLDVENKVEGESDEYLYLYSFIIGRHGEYIVHPNKDFILKNNYKDYVESTSDTIDNYVCQSMLEGKSGQVEMPVNNSKSFVYFAPVGRAGWSMAVVVPWISMYLWTIGLGVVVLLIMVVGTLVVFLFCRYHIHSSTKPLVFLTESADEVAKGHFDDPIPEMHSHDEIQRLRDSFVSMQHSLTDYVSRLQTTTAEKASIERELDIARNIQMSMLPKTFPPFPNRKDIDIYGELKPAKAVGGDLYDFFIHNEQLYFCIGDVSGKGVPASLVMAVTRSLFRNVATHAINPNVIAQAINESICENNDSNMFVTLFIGVLDLHTLQLTYSNAGHDAPWLLTSDGVDMLPCDSNLPVGVMNDCKYSIQQKQLKKGTTLFLYTDGLTEAEDVTHQLFGMGRIRQVLQTASADVRPLVDTMSKAVRDFVGEAEQSDDLTMMAVRIMTSNDKAFQ